MSSGSISHLGTKACLLHVEKSKKEDICCSEGTTFFSFPETGCPFAVFLCVTGWLVNDDKPSGGKDGLRELEQPEGLLRSTHFLCQVGLVGFFIASPPC